MSPLSFVLTIASIFFLFFAVDGMQRRRFSILHFFVFVGWAVLILSFVFVPWFQERFGRVFGVARGSDVIVYSTLIILWYFYFELLHEVTKQKSQTTRLVTADAMREIWAPQMLHGNANKDQYVFLMRAYNEAESIGEVIDAIIHKGFSKIVIVNDGSSDATKAVLEKKKATYHDKHIVVLSHVINRWGWAANKTWFAYVTAYAHELNASWIVTYDADGQMNIDDMDRFMKLVDHHGKTYKAYLGTRFIPWWEAVNMPEMRKIILRGSKVITLLFNRLSVSDPHNGYRVLHTSILPKIHLTSDGMMYASELLDCIRIHDIPFLEVPVRINYTEYSLGKWQKNRNALKILAELIYKKIFFK